MTRSATQNWTQLPIVVMVMVLCVLTWVSMGAKELGLEPYCGGESVSIPREMSHAAAYRDTTPRSAITISVPKEGQLFWGKRQTSAAALVENIKQSVSSKPEPERVVYLKLSDDVPYLSFAEVLNLIRQAGVLKVALVVHRKETAAAGSKGLGVLDVTLHPEREPCEDLTKDIGMLLADITSNGKVRLSVYECGNIEDFSPFVAKVKEVMARRSEKGNHDRLVMVDAAQDVNYRDVAKLIDSLADGGANPIMIDPTPVFTPPPQPPATKTIRK